MQRRPSLALNFIAISAISTLSATAFAHEGHGMPGSHWHATDVFGFVALACAMGLAWWLFRDRD